MITMLHGYPGGGKSYYAVSQYIIPHMKKRRHVYSSLAGFDALRAGVIHGVDPIYYHPISPENFTPWLDIDETQTESLFVLDEVQNLYGASNFKDHGKERELLKKYLSMHRHRGDAVVAICQEPTTVDKFFRDLTEHYIELRKLNMIFGENANTFSAIHKKGGTGKSNKVLKQETLQYKDEFTICYQSTMPGAEETKTKSDKVRVHPLKIFWPIIAAFLFLLVGAGLYLWNRNKTKPVNPPPPGVGQTMKQETGITHVPKISIEADGWMADSNCVFWLKGASLVARSCPDLGERFGRLECRVTSGGDSCTVHVEPGALVGQADGGQKSALEFEGTRTSGRGPTAPSSPLSSRSSE